MKPTETAIYDLKKRFIKFYDEEGQELYEFSIDDLRSTGEVLDWILQIHLKTWCTDKMMRDFLRCLQQMCKEVFGNTIQGVFSPHGLHMKIDWEKRTYSRID